MKSIEDYVKLEPKIFKQIYDKRNELLKDFLTKVSNKEFDDIVIYATGSSSNAAYTAQPFLSKVLQKPVYIFEPSLILGSTPVFSKRTLYLAISEGGHSRSIEKIIELLQAQTKLVWLITSNLDSPVGNKANNKLFLGMKEEMPYVSAGFSSEVLFLALLALEFSKVQEIISGSEYSIYQSDIEKFLIELPECINQAELYVNKNKDYLSEKKRFIFIGYGATYGIAREAETKITETFGHSAWGKELEEYMHGPYLGLKSDDFICFIDGKGILQEREQKLCKFLKEYVKDVCLFTTDSNLKFNQNLDFKFESKIIQTLSALLLVIPIHLLAFKLSQIKGISLETSRYPDFDKLTHSKI